MSVARYVQVTPDDVESATDVAFAGDRMVRKWRCVVPGIAILVSAVVAAALNHASSRGSQAQARPEDAYGLVEQQEGGLTSLPLLTQPHVIKLGMNEGVTMSFLPWEHNFPMPFTVGGEDAIVDVVVNGVAYMYCKGTFGEDQRCDAGTDPRLVLASGAFPGATVVLPVDSELKLRFQNLVKCASASTRDAGGYHGFGGKCSTNIHFHGAFSGGGVWPDNHTLMDMITMEVGYDEYVDYRIVYPSAEKLGPLAPGSRHQIIHPHFDPMVTLQMGGGAMSNLMIDESELINKMLSSLTGGNIPHVSGLSNSDANELNRDTSRNLDYTIERLMAVSKIDMAQLKKIGQISGGCSVNETIAQGGESSLLMTFNKTTASNGKTKSKEVVCGWYNWACHDAAHGDHSCGKAKPKYDGNRPHPDIFEPLYGSAQFPYVITLNGFAQVTKMALRENKWELWHFSNMGWATGSLNLRFECAHLSEKQGVVPMRGNAPCSGGPSGQCKVKCSETCHMRLWSKDGQSLRDPFRNISRVSLPAAGRAAVLVMCTHDPSFALQPGEIRGQTYLYARDFTQHMYPDLLIFSFRAPLSRIELVESEAREERGSQGWNGWQPDDIRTQQKVQVLGLPPAYLGELEKETVTDNCTLPHSYLGGNVYAKRAVDTPKWTEQQWHSKSFLADHACVNPSLSTPAHPQIDSNLSTNPHLATSIQKLAGRFNAQGTAECIRFNPFQYMHRAACGELVDDIISMISAHPHHMHLHHFALQEFYSSTYESVTMDSIEVQNWIEASSGLTNGVTDYEDLGQKEYFRIGDYHDTFLPHGVPNARLRHLVDCKNLSPTGVMTSIINHCHILSHEDTGMMYQLGVTPAGTGCSWELPMFKGDWGEFMMQMTGSPDAFPEWKDAVRRVYNAKAKSMKPRRNL